MTRKSNPVNSQHPKGSGSPEHGSSGHVSSGHGNSSHGSIPPSKGTGHGRIGTIVSPIGGGTEPAPPSNTIPPPATTPPSSTTPPTTTTPPTGTMPGGGNGHGHNGHGHGHDTNQTQTTTPTYPWSAAIPASGAGINASTYANSSPESTVNLGYVYNGGGYNSVSSHIPASLSASHENSYTGYGAPAQAQPLFASSSTSTATSSRPSSGFNWGGLIGAAVGLFVGAKTMLAAGMSTTLAMVGAVALAIGGAWVGGTGSRLVSGFMKPKTETATTEQNTQLLAVNTPGLEQNQNIGNLTPPSTPPIPPRTPNAAGIFQ